MAQGFASNPAYTVSFQGQNNLSGDVRDLFLKLYAGKSLLPLRKRKSLWTRYVLVPLVKVNLLHSQ